MSLKAELETWSNALKAYDEENLGKALELFSVRILLLAISHGELTLRINALGHSGFVKDIDEYWAHLCYHGRARDCCGAI